MKKDQKKEDVMLSIRICPKANEALRKMAESEMRSLSNMIEVAILERASGKADEAALNKALLDILLGVEEGEAAGSHGVATPRKALLDLFRSRHNDAGR